MHSHGHHEVAQSGFWDMWAVEPFLFSLLLSFVYWWFVNTSRPRFAHHKPVTGKQRAYFFLGVFFFLLAMGSPAQYYGHHLFFVHMIQQVVLYMIVPPLLLLGLPQWLYDEFLGMHGTVKKLARALTHPFIAGSAFNILFSFYHIPLILDAIMSNMWLHYLSHALLSFTSFLLWVPIIAPTKELDRLSDLRKIAYVFANGIMLTPACALIFLAGSPLYEAYSHPESILPLTAVEDQQIGGVAMKLIQELVYGIALFHTFFRWYRRERTAKQEHDVMSVPHKTAKPYA